jgi:plastocyanin
MRRFAAFLTLVALAFIAAACSGDGEPPGATQNDGAAQAAIEVEITADGFNPASAEVTVGQEINFNNNDSKPHTIIVPAGHEQVVEAGETFNFKDEGCCAATFTDKETGAEFEVTVGDS